MDSHGKGTHDFNSVLPGEAVKEKVVAESNLLVAPFGVLVPCPSLILVCLSTNCCVMGRQSSSEVSYEDISLG